MISVTSTTSRSRIKFVLYGALERSLATYILLEIGHAISARARYYFSYYYLHISKGSLMYLVQAYILQLARHDIFSFINIYLHEPYV